MMNLEHDDDLRAAAVFIGKYAPTITLVRPSQDDFRIVLDWPNARPDSGDGRTSAVLIAHGRSEGEAVLNLQQQIEACREVYASGKMAPPSPVPTKREMIPTAP